MTTALATARPHEPVVSIEPAAGHLPIPWRDPHTVSPEVLSHHIQALEQACLDNPQSADLRTCLGMAYAVNYDVYKSLDALQAATAIDPQHFWAQLKYAELLYRLRALPRSEAETLKAIDLAENGWQLSIARKQLQEIRRLQREGARHVHWHKPLLTPTLVCLGMIVLLFVAFALK